MRGDVLKVTAWLSSPLAGDPPMLDAILEFEMAQRLGLAHKIRRDHPAPAFGTVHIPMLMRSIGGVSVPCCSSPIVSPEHDASEHYAKRLAVEHAGLLSPQQRKVVAMGNALYKSYRLPLHIRVVDRVVWYAIAHRKHVLKLCKSVHSIGKKRSQGYGRIARWEAMTVPVDWTWYAPSDAGQVLMRPLPVCNELPGNLIGFSRSFGACQAPYWHPDRYMEIVIPC